MKKATLILNVTQETGLSIAKELTSDKIVNVVEFKAVRDYFACGFTGCDIDTQVVIVTDVLEDQISDLYKLITGEIPVEHVGKDTFFIRPEIIGICSDSGVSITGYSLSRRTSFVKPTATTPADIELQQRNLLRDKYPLIKEQFDILDCPYCDTTCFPDAKTADNTIIYSRHDCKPSYDLFPVSRRFEIDANGDIVD